MIKLNNKAEQPIFKVGDFLQRNNPYPGEHEKMVMLVDIDKQRYDSINRRFMSLPFITTNYRST